MGDWLSWESACLGSRRSRVRLSYSPLGLRIVHCTVRFLLHIQSQAIKDRLCYLVLARKYYSLSLIMWRIRHSDEMRSILELLDKEKSDKLCQIYATKKHPTARNL